MGTFSNNLILLWDAREGIVIGRVPASLLAKSPWSASRTMRPHLRIVWLFEWYDVLEWYVENVCCLLFSEGSNL